MEAEQEANGAQQTLGGRAQSDSSVSAMHWPWPAITKLSLWGTRCDSVRKRGATFQTGDFMKQHFWRFLCGFVLYVLSGPTPGEADITDSTKNWESPVDGQAISGIQVFRGFAYSTTAMPVLVTLTVVSPITGTFDIPWGSARADVGPNPPQLNSGFGFTANMGALPPGPVTITLEFREGTGSGPCTPPSCVSETRTFTVAKPGGRAEESPQLFSFLNNLTPAGATVTLDGDELIVAPATVQDSGGGTRQSTLRLRWLQNSQAFGIVSAASGTSFAAVQQIFSNSCALSGCHDNGSHTQNLNLSPGQAFASIVAIRSVENADLFRINPGADEGESYLYRKVSGEGAIAGVRMPLGCPSQQPCLTQDEIDTIENWIKEGAPPPQE